MADTQPTQTELAAYFYVASLVNEYVDETQSALVTTSTTAANHKKRADNALALLKAAGVDTAEMVRAPSPPA